MYAAFLKIEGAPGAVRLEGSDSHDSHSVSPETGRRLQAGSLDLDLPILP